ncbi:GDSL family lipase, partial [Serratia marcescens]
MKDLNDNALAYDDFLNSNEDQAFDRFQKPFPTVRRQVADRIDEITEAQKSIEQYTDEAKQAAENAQNIADANTYY